MELPKQRRELRWLREITVQKWSRADEASLVATTWWHDITRTVSDAMITVAEVSEVRRQVRAGVFGCLGASV